MSFQYVILWVLLDQRGRENIISHDFCSELDTGLMIVFLFYFVLFFSFTLLEGFCGRNQTLILTKAL